MPVTTTVDNTVDVIDTRDLIERIKELQEQLDEVRESVEDREFGSVTETEARLMIMTGLVALMSSEELAELDQLKQLGSDVEGYCEDYRHGVVLIRDSYFKEYAQDLADDLYGDVKPDHWPFTCIDWDQAADELKVDYTAFEFGGVTYWGR